jgi:hypothetical protein
MTQVADTIKQDDIMVFFNQFYFIESTSKSIDWFADAK